MGERLYFERFVWFDSQIRKKSYPNATTLAEKFECTVKTAQRAVEYFRDRLRAPLVYEHARKGYAYSDPNFQLPVTHLCGVWRPVADPGSFPWQQQSEEGNHPVYL